MINKIRTLLDIDVKLETKKLENGTVIEAESFSAGSEVFIKTEDNKVAMPVGEYTLESGEVMLVKEEGLIAELGSYGDKKKDEEEMEDDGKEADVQDWAGMEKRIKNLEDAIADLKSKMGDDKEEEDMEVDTEEEELKSEEVVEETKEEVNEELKQELSEPAVEPIKHSPENSKKKPQHLYAQNRSKTTRDRILEKIANF